VQRKNFLGIYSERGPSASLHPNSRLRRFEGCSFTESFDAFVSLADNLILRRRLTGRTKGLAVMG